MPVKDERWAQRQAAIRSLLGRREIRRQEDLLGLLRKDGFHVTQSSVSRDLAELGAVKVEGRYVLPPTGGATGAQSEIAEAAAAVRDVRAAGPNLLVVLTPAGLAQRVGLALDRVGWPEVVGTIAGDDTVFVATTGRRPQDRVVKRLHEAARGSNDGR
jgi:transcriptional regulator of arginine metabolism